MWHDFFSLLIPILTLIPIGMAVIRSSEYHEERDAEPALWPGPGLMAE